MSRIWIYALGCVAGLLSSASVAFEEQKMPPAQTPPAAAGSAAEQSVPSVSLTDAGVAVPRISAGTKIRVPGLGVIGEIPKMEFGLELLYGASQPRASEIDRGDGNGLMGRVTVPLKTPR